MLSSDYDPTESTLVDMAHLIFKVTEFMDLVLLAEAISLKIGFFQKMPLELLCSSDRRVSTKIRRREGQIYGWSWVGAVKEFGGRECSQTQDSSKGKVASSSPLGLDANKQDQINTYLLSNLKVPQEEQQLHRIFFAGNVELDEGQWARQVLKYWLLDGAATRVQHEVESRNGAVDSAGKCHSAKVLFNTDNAVHEPSMPLFKRMEVTVDMG